MSPNVYFNSCKSMSGWGNVELWKIPEWNPTFDLFSFFNKTWKISLLEYLSHKMLFISSLELILVFIFYQVTRFCQKQKHFTYRKKIYLFRSNWKRLILATQSKWDQSSSTNIIMKLCSEQNFSFFVTDQWRELKNCYEKWIKKLMKICTTG